MRCVKCTTNKRLENPEFKRKYEAYEQGAEVAVAIAKERIRQKLSKAKVARMAGVSRHQYSRMEDLEPTKPEVVEKIKAALGMDRGIINDGE